MKKILLITIILTVMLSRVFAQAPSFSFNGPAIWVPGSEVTLGVNLTFTGFSALGLAYWLEPNNAIAPFLSAKAVRCFTFCGDPSPVPPGTYHVADITFSLAAGAPGGVYTIRSTTLPPRTSALTDTNFSEHNISESSFIFRVLGAPDPLR